MQPRKPAITARLDAGGGSGVTAGRRYAVAARFLQCGARTSRRTEPARVGLPGRSAQVPALSVRHHAARRCRPPALGRCAGGARRRRWAAWRPCSANSVVAVVYRGLEGGQPLVPDGRLLEPEPAPRRPAPGPVGHGRGQPILRRVPPGTGGRTVRAPTPVAPGDRLDPASRTTRVLRDPAGLDHVRRLALARRPAAVAGLQRPELTAVVPREWRANGLGRSTGRRRYGVVAEH